MRIASSLIKKHRPRATHRPARVAMNGWTFRYVMKKPIVAPKADAHQEHRGR